MPPESRSKSVAVAMQDSAFVGFRTAGFEVRVTNPLRLVIRDLAGNVTADAPGTSRVKFQQGGFTIYKEMPGAEHYFGLGDKPVASIVAKQAYTLWNTDVGPQESVDPPTQLFLAINGTHSYGIFLDNTYLVRFRQVCAHRVLIRRRGRSDRLLHFIYGPTPKQVVENYAYLTGKSPLPPLWVLGFQQSRYSYTPESWPDPVELGDIRDKRV